MIMNSNIIHTLKYVINQTGSTLAFVECNLTNSMDYNETIECGLEKKLEKTSMWKGYVFFLPKYLM